MTFQDAAWARKHDWYSSCIKEGSGFRVFVNCGDEHHAFTCIKKLRAWAGY